MNTDPILTVSIEFPFSHRRPVNRAIRLSAGEFREALRPLPRCREFIPEQTQIAMEQEAKREAITRMLVPRLAAQLAKLIEEEDTVNGYTKAELADRPGLAIMQDHLEYIREAKSLTDPEAR